MSGLSYFFECFKKAVAAYIVERVMMEGDHLQNSTFWMLIFTRIILMSVISFISLF